MSSSSLSHRLRGGVGGAGESGAADASGKPRNFPLFSLSKLVSVSNIDTMDKRQILEEEGAVRHDVSIRAVASAGHTGHNLIALACTNNTIVLRYHDASGVPMVRVMSWFKDPSQRVAAMTFSPDAKCLLVASEDSTLYLVPIYYLLCGDHARKSKMDAQAVRNGPPPTLTMLLKTKRGGSARGAAAAAANVGTEYVLAVDEVSEISAATKPKPADVSDVVWWRLWNGDEYAIIASLAGTLTFVNLRTRNDEPDFLFRLKYAIRGIELVSDPQGAYRYVLVHTTKGGYWSLLLEQERSSSGSTGGAARRHDILPNHLGKSPFLPMYLARFSPQHKLGAHTMRGRPVLSVFHPDTGKYEVYGTDLDLDMFAQYVFQLAPRSRFLHLTDSLIFAVTGEPATGQHLSVVSNLISGTSGSLVWNFDDRNTSIMQRFQLPAGQTVRGIFPAFPPCDGEPTRALQGFFLWTDDTLYELRSNEEPQAIFNKLIDVGLERPHADDLGKTLGLDIHALYEQAGDRYFRAKSYMRALSLYSFSNASKSKLVYMFSQTAHVAVVMKHLEEALRNPAALPMAARRAFSEMLLHCYVFQLLAHTHAVVELRKLRATFQAFLISNTDYDAVQCLDLLVTCGLTSLLLEAAHARHMMPHALCLLYRKGVVTLDADAMQLLKDKGYTGELMVSAEGRLFRTLPPAQQVDAMLADIRNVYHHFTRLHPLVATLDEANLVRVARYLDDGERKWRRAARTLHASPEEAALGKQEYVELYLTVLLILLFRGYALPAPTSQADAKPTSPAVAMAQADAMPTSPAAAMAHAIERARSLSSASAGAVASGGESGVPTGEAGSDATGAPLEEGPGMTPASASASLAAGESGAQLQQRFERELRQRAGSYRPAVLLQRCADWHNHRGSALLFELVGDWPNALECMLNACASAHRTDRDACAHAALELVRSHVLAASAAREKAQLLQQLLLFWQRHALPADTLESCLQEHMTELGHPLSLLLEDEEGLIWQTAFSPPLYLRITQARLAHMGARAHAEHASGAAVSEDKLWAEITSNLEKDLGKCTHITVPVLTLQKLAARAPEGDATSVGFSCGHVYLARLFHTDILAMFQERMNSLPTPLPLTTKVSVGDYRQPKISQACPVCVFASVRSELLAENPRLRISAWEL